MRAAGCHRADRQLVQADRRDVDQQSGATWSPRYATYGGNDRTHYLRVPDRNRVELRGGDGSANPYLAAAAALAAGLDGIERELDPGDPGAGDGPATCCR